jgi:hypothetical protein
MDSINSYPPKNNNQLYNNKEFIKLLITSIRHNLKKNNNLSILPSLSREQINMIIHLLRDTNPNIFVGRTPNEILKILTEFIISEFKKINCDYSDIDIHEMQKVQLGLKSDVIISETSALNQESDQKIANTIVEQISGMVGISSFMGLSSLTELLSYINPASVVKYAYISLDSKNRSLNNDGTQFIQWFPNTLSNIIPQGNFYLDPKVRDIIEIRIMPIKMPYISSADNDYGRITMYINEFSTQAYLNSDNLRYHFVFSSDVIDRWIHLRTYTNNEGIFKFSTSLTQIPSITLTFSSPFDKIIFDNDRLNNFQIYDYKTLNKTYLETPSLHNLETGDRIYISNFTTLNPSSDNGIITLINNPIGLICTYIDDNKILVDINSNNIYKQGNGSITLTNGSNLISGLGTNFGSLFNINDYISINSNKYKIITISSDTNMNIETDWTDPTSTFPTYYRDNRIPNLNVSIYFGSKRLFINMQIAYLFSPIKN